MSVGGPASSSMCSFTSAESWTPLPSRYWIPRDVPEVLPRRNATGSSLRISTFGSERYLRLSLSSSKPSSVRTCTWPLNVAFLGCA